ncbi:hypothetical protein V2K54_25600 [Pseudomonas alliivorans]|nr:hypothetical protein [Pseudomonas alliivorans]
MNPAFRLSRWMFNFFDDNRKEFYEDFASALKDGASPNERLKQMSVRAKQRNNGWAPLYEHWLRKMRRMSFARALQHTVPDYEVMVLTAAEEDAKLDEAMVYLGRAIRLSSRIKSSYFMSLVSPVLTAITLLGYLVIHALMIAPQNLQTLPLEKWPGSSRTIYVLSDGLVNGSLYITVGVILSFWVVMWSKPNWRGKARYWADRFPLLPWKSYREREANNFLVSMAILLQSNNHGPKEALEQMRKFASPWLSWHLARMLKRMELTPNEPAKALNTGLFPLQLMDRIEDYAARTDFTKALRILAFDHSEKQVQMAERRAVVTGYLAMLFITFFIGLIAWANFEFSQATEAYVQAIR